MAKLEGEKIRQFVEAGQAVFTVTSRKTGTRFTYRVAVAKNGAVSFVSVLTGPDNTASYSYLGFVRDGQFFHGGAKAAIGREAPSALAFAWFWRSFVLGAHPTAGNLAEVHHEGRCGRCGRALTVPESVESGLGPECAQRMAS